MDNATGGEGEKQVECSLIKICARKGVRAETFQEVKQPANHLSGPAEDWFRRGPALALNMNPEANKMNGTSCTPLGNGVSPMKKQAGRGGSKKGDGAAGK